MKFVYYLLNLAIFPIACVILIGILSILLISIYNLILKYSHRYLLKLYITTVYIISAYIFGVISAYWISLLIFYSNWYHKLILIPPLVLIAIIVYKVFAAEHRNKQLEIEIVKKELQIKMYKNETNYDISTLGGFTISITMLSAFIYIDIFLILFIIFPNLKHDLYMGLVENLIRVFN